MKKILIITVLLITQLLINCREKQDDMTGLFALLAAAASTVTSTGTAPGTSTGTSPGSSSGADSIAPTLLSTVPANGSTTIPVCTGTPCIAKITLVFSESMNTSLTQSLTTENFDATIYNAIANSGTTYSWSQTSVQNDTLTIHMSWRWFPGHSKLRFNLAKAGLSDTAGNTISADIQQTFTTTAANQHFSVADTGITACYSATAATACADAGFPNQDGDHTNIPNARSFTLPTQHSSFTTDYTTKDNVTGLIWKSCSEGLSGSNCATGSGSSMNWYSAIDKCSVLNTMNSGSGYAGKKNWRLPTTTELETISNYGNTSPSIDTGSFPATVLNSYWTAATASDDASKGYQIRFTYPQTDTIAKTTNNFVRCVSSPDAIDSPTYTDNGDGTITDNMTNLRWQKCPNGYSGADCLTGAAVYSNWTNSLLYCDALNLGTFGNSTNWRLPSAFELKSLLRRSENSPTIHSTYFPNAIWHNSWSSTTYPPSPSIGYVVFFSSGGFSNIHAKGNSNSTRCVATGP